MPLPPSTTRRPSEPSHRRATVAALVVTVLWSSSWIMIRAGLDDEDIDPLTFAGLRYSVAALVLVAWVVSRPPLRQAARSLDRRIAGRLALFGVVFVGITQGAQFVAIDNQPAATTSLTLAPTALLVAVASGWSLGERASRRQHLGAALILVGAFVYLAGDLGATAVGMTAAVIGLLANVSSSLMGRSLNRGGGLPPVVITAISMAIGAALLFGVGLSIEGVPRLTPTLVVIIGWLAVVNTALAFTLWNWSQRHLAAVETAALNNTMLVQIAALAWIFLDEGPGVAGVVGIVIVSVGTFLATVTVVSRRANDAT